MDPELWDGIIKPLGFLLSKYITIKKCFCKDKWYVKNWLLYFATQIISGFERNKKKSLQYKAL